MSYLKVDVVQAKQIASDLKQNAEARVSDLATLGSKANPANVWEGEAARAYQEKYDQWKTAEQRLVDALRELGVVVDRIITNFDEVNRQGASALS